MDKQTTQITPFQKEQIVAAKKIAEYKLSAEASMVALIYKNPDLIDTCDLTLEDLSNNVWKCGFAIAKGLRSEGINTLSAIDVGMYLDKHQKLKAKVEEYGGYQTFVDAGAYVDEDNFESFVTEIKKWNAVLSLLKFGFPVSEKLSQYADMTAEQIYQELDGYISHVFANTSSKIRSYDALTDLNDLVDKLDAGDEVGMPIASPLLNDAIGGLRLGNIYSFTAASGTGKSTLLISYILPEVMKYKRKCVMIINEEDVTRVRKDLLTWTCSNVLNKPINKVVLRDGKFDEDTKATLHEAANWLEAQNDNHLITVIPLDHYNASTVVKLMHKYKNLFGCDLFIVDTFKESADAEGKAYESMVRDSRLIYDAAKPAGLNCTVVLSLQMSKGSMKTRHLTNMDIGQAKSVVDVFSVSILVRKAELDEYDQGERELKCFRLEGKNKKTKIPFTLDPDKHYFLFFLGKNRFGETDTLTIVTEVDLGTDKFIDRGYCIVPDFVG